jgi:hypothetical protein
MKLRRDVLIAVLATFCLTSALFAVKPSGSLSSKQYDPWMDINDDGRIDMRDIGQLCINFGAAGTPINKTALLLEILSKIDNLNTSLNTRVPKKGCISISPVAFTPFTDTQTYLKGESGLWGQGRFDVNVQLPNGVTLTKMIARVTDRLTDGWIDVYIRGLNITSGYGLDTLAEVKTGIGEAPGTVLLYDDTINAVIDNKNCVYTLSVLLSKYDTQLCLEGVILEYEYSQ